MLPIIVQVAAVTVATVGLLHWRRNLRRRNARSWESLLARLQPDCTAYCLGDLSCLMEPHRNAPAARWKALCNTQGLWAMYRNAGVMLEIADYAVGCATPADPELLADLRSDAIQIRLCVLETVARIAFSATRDSICMSALRTESMFAEMQMRLTELLAANAADRLPGFVAAM